MVNLASFRSQGGAAFTTDPAYLNRFSGLVGDLENAGYPVIGAQSGGYNPRNIAGTNTPSEHSFGRAIDVNWNRNARGTKGDIDPTMARDLAKKYGLTWGGDWKNPDPMHFEVSDGGQSEMRPPSQYGLPNYGYGGVTQQSIAGQMPGSPQMMALGGPVPQGPKTAPGDLAAAVAAYNGPTPEDVALQRKMALEMGQQASDTSPVGHWTQALARVLQGGISGMEMDAARKGEAQGTQAIVDMLRGKPQPTATDLIANPWTREIGLKAAGRQLMPEYGKQGTTIQDANGNFYTMQFDNLGNRKIVPLEVGGQAPASVTVPSEFGSPQTVMSTRLQPAKGVKQVGNELVDQSTGQAVRRVDQAIQGKEKAEEVGKAEGKAVANLPVVIGAAESALKTIEQIRNHPGKASGVGGIGGMAPAIPFTQQGSFVDLVEQSKNQAFLTAYNVLRGGGAITEAEGSKATGALNRMNRARRMEDFDTALKDYEDVIRSGMERAKQMAGGNFGQPAQPQQAQPQSGSWGMRRLD